MKKEQTNTAQRLYPLYYVFFEPSKSTPLGLLKVTQISFDEVKEELIAGEIPDIRDHTAWTKADLVCSEPKDLWSVHLYYKEILTSSEKRKRRKKRTTIDQRS